MYKKSHHENDLQVSLYLDLLLLSNLSTAFTKCTYRKLGVFIGVFPMIIIKGETFYFFDPRSIRSVVGHLIRPTFGFVCLTDVSDSTIPVHYGRGFETTER